MITSSSNWSIWKCLTLHACLKWFPLSLKPKTANTKRCLINNDYGLMLNALYPQKLTSLYHLNWYHEGFKSNVQLTVILKNSCKLRLISTYLEKKTQSINSLMEKKCWAFLLNILALLIWWNIPGVIVETIYPIYLIILCS